MFIKEIQADSWSLDSTGTVGKPTNKDTVQIVLSVMKTNVGYHEKTK